MLGEGTVVRYVLFTDIKILLSIRARQARTSFSGVQEIRVYLENEPDEEGNYRIQEYIKYSATENEFNKY